MLPRLLVLLPVLALSACSGGDDDKGDDGDDTSADTDTATDDTGTDTADTADTADTDTPAPRTFGLTGVLVNRMSGETITAADGVCVSVLDPGPFVESGNPTDALVLVTGEVADEGAYSVTVETTSALGLVLLADDCDPEVENFAPTGTWIPPRAYQNLPAEEAALNVPGSWVLPANYLPRLAEELATTSYTGDLVAAGVLVGTVRAADVPVEGATASCESCTDTVLYPDGDPSDGRFSTGETLNAATTANGDFVVPGGAWDLWNVSNGTDTFPGERVGAFPGRITIVTFRAVEATE
ncbi:MAG: hypothetical protein ACK4YP_00215 [Myxococcota bacterium]